MVILWCVSSIVAASITPDDLSDFTALYREHCEVMSFARVSILQRSTIFVLVCLYFAGNFGCGAEPPISNG